VDLEVQKFRITGRVENAKPDAKSKGKAWVPEGKERDGGPD